MKRKVQGFPNAQDRSWFSSFLLVLLVCGAVIGVFSGISPEIMIALGALALIVFEFTDQAANNLNMNGGFVRSISNHANGRLLVASVGIGAILAEVGFSIHFRLPFAIIILATLLILTSLFYFYRLLIK